MLAVNPACKSLLCQEFPLQFKSAPMCCQARATPLTPSEWQEMLRSAMAPATLGAGGGAPGGISGGASGGNLGGPSAGGNAQEVVVLDVRNAYEWDAGHFVGAQRPLEVRSRVFLGYPVGYDFVSSLALGMHAGWGSHFECVLHLEAIHCMVI